MAKRKPWGITTISPGETSIFPHSVVINNPGLGSKRREWACVVCFFIIKKSVVFPTFHREGMRHPKIAAKIEGTQTSSILVCFGGNNRSVHVIVNCYPNCYGPMVVVVNWVWWQNKRICECILKKKNKVIKPLGERWAYACPREQRRSEERWSEDDDLLPCWGTMRKSPSALQKAHPSMDLLAAYLE